MKSFPITGTNTELTFFEDDTIETVRQWAALALQSHPDRLFLQVKQTFAKDTYANNPKRWTDLFNRLSYDGTKIVRDVMQVYLTQYRADAPSVTAREITREEWESKPEGLQPLYDPPTDFEEWRCLGVEEEKSVVIPIPPPNLLPLKPSMYPVPKIQSLFATFHDYETVSEFRAIEYRQGAMSDRIVNIYFPFLSPDTPNNIESLRGALQTSQTHLKNLLALDVPHHQKASIVRAKWYIPLISTEFSSPRARFEQIFYGMTVNETTPYIGYYTSKAEATRHKFYVTDPKTKETHLDTTLWKAWTINTQPQRKLPTLLLYRGKARNVFDRIAVTPKDITVTVYRNKTSTKTLEDYKSEVLEWMKTLDALTPFLKETDIEPGRWSLADLSLIATYESDVQEFDMHRFPCLQSIFGFQNNTFRLLRSEHATDDISPRLLQTAQVFQQEGAEVSASYLMQELGIPEEEATQLVTEYQQKAEARDFEKTLRTYPTITFSNKEVIVKFVTSIERTLLYADLLRYVLSAGPDVNIPGCERRMEVIAPKAVVVEQTRLEDVQSDIEFGAAILEYGDEEEEAPAPAPAPVPKRGRKVQVGKPGTTYNYFNARLQAFDPDTFDESIYTGKCEKKRQVVVLTPQDQADMPAEFSYTTAPPLEKLDLNDPDGIAICPPYWCMRDEIPLRQDQLITGEDGELHCPVCNGKLRKNDKLDATEFPVIVRDAAEKYPKYLDVVSSINQRNMPCCYKTPRKESVAVLEPKEELYIQQSDTGTLPATRLAYLSPELATALKVPIQYETTTSKSRLATSVGDVFRIGVGRPSKTLPLLLNDPTPILRPREAPDNVKRCSFYRTWPESDPIAGIDAAYEAGQLTIQDEVEYVTTFLLTEVIRVDLKKNEVVCGFWADIVGGARSRTIVMLDDDLLVYVERRKRTGDKTYKPYYTADLRKPPFTEAYTHLRSLHTRACSFDIPVFEDAIRELMLRGKSQYEVILDPFERIQALLVANEVILPIHPSARKPDIGVPVRSGYSQVKGDLPSGASQRAFLEGTQHPKFKVARELKNLDGYVVELQLESGFRVPIKPEQGEGTLGDAWNTVQKHEETDLVIAKPNKEDVRMAQEITYSEEIYQFLLFSLSKSIQADADGQAMNETYQALRTAIQTQSPDILETLRNWFELNAYEDATNSPIRFVNKVRTPCGQFTQDENACKKSSLCGWTGDSCKIKVKPIVNTNDVLKRIAKTLRTNAKQRALVLDTRISPFFSTILYLEMPHEWITVSV